MKKEDIMEKDQTEKVLIAEGKNLPQTRLMKKKQRIVLKIKRSSDELGTEIAEEFI